MGGKEGHGYSTTHLYDGDHVTAEYDGNDNLVRKLVVSPFGYARVDSAESIRLWPVR